jgi:hypothetical protein
LPGQQRHAGTCHPAAAFGVNQAEGNSPVRDGARGGKSERAVDIRQSSERN